MEHAERERIIKKLRIICLYSVISISLQKIIAHLSIRDGIVLILINKKVTMKKKCYSKPYTDVIEMCSQSMLAASPYSATTEPTQEYLSPTKYV